MMMIFQMFGMRWQKRKIGQPIVGPVAVDVMHNLFPFQCSSKMLFHHDTMFEASSALKANLPIAVLIDCSRTVWRSFNDAWVSMSLPLFIVIVTVSSAYASVFAAFNGTIGLHLLDDCHRVAMYPPSRVVFSAPTTAKSFSSTTFNRARQRIHNTLYQSS